MNLMTIQPLAYFFTPPVHPKNKSVTQIILFPSFTFISPYNSPYALFSGKFHGMPHIPITSNINTDLVQFSS